MSVTLQPTADSTAETPREGWPVKCDVFGIGISPTTYEEASRIIVDAGKRRESRLVSCYAVHALITFAGEQQLRSVSNDFDMVTPDGQPVRWALNLLHGTKLADRVYGPDLTLDICRRAAAEGVAVYLYGGSPDVADKLPVQLKEMLPNLKIAGSESPPFRGLTPEEDQEVIDRINNSGAGIVFIGLGCPKQDLFAHEHRDSIRAVQVCVGAAFDFHAGAKSTAPSWMQKRGLEWAYRLLQEPGRLWRRYLVTNSIYVMKLLWCLANFPRVLVQRMKQKRSRQSAAS